MEIIARLPHLTCFLPVMLTRTWVPRTRTRTFL